MKSMLHDLIGSETGVILWWQMMARAALVFLFGLTIIRLFGRTAFGMQTPVDIVLAVVIGSNLSRTLTGNAPFVPTLAGTLALVILFWLFRHFAARSQVFSRLVKGDPTTLIRHGRLDRKKMRGAAISEGDIEEAARYSGLSGLGHVGEAVLERSGKISTIRSREDQQDPGAATPAEPHGIS
jgi:uncharacterized membrane protein YcaP (DUF421 family)